MPYQSVDNVTMFYRLEGSGPPVLLLHGMGSCADDWFFQFPALVDRYTVLAVDLRGHGRSAAPPAPYTIAGMADEVAALMVALQLDLAHVVGLSLGGLVAQSLAVRHAERVRTLVLVNTFARLRPRGLRGWWYFLKRGVALLTGGVEAQAEVVARGVFPKPEHALLRQATAERLRANNPAAYRATMRAVVRFDGRRDLARIAVPTLVIAGVEDTTVHLAAKEALAAGIRGARFEAVPNSGHATPLDQPEVFNRLLREFF
ncbi:MAG: alpha/beta fold hydrolase [Anaerolineae bacterium]|nr:alpha/beta fold hydrolase [Anaerolineae bacterium]